MEASSDPEKKALSDAQHKESSYYGFNYELLLEQAEKAFFSYVDSGKSNVGDLANAALLCLHCLEFILPTPTVRAVARFHNQQTLESLPDKKKERYEKEIAKLSKINRKVINWINRAPFDNDGIEPPTHYDNLIYGLIDKAPMILAIESLANHFKHSSSRDTDESLEVIKLEGFKSKGARAGDAVGMVTFSVGTKKSVTRVDFAVEECLDLLRQYRAGKAIHEIIEDELLHSHGSD